MRRSGPTDSEHTFTVIRVHRRARLAWVIVVCMAHAVGSAAQTVADVAASAKKSNFVQAFAQSRGVLAASPTSEHVSALQALFAKYPQIQESGVAALSVLIRAARTEEDLLRAQAQVLHFAKCVKSDLCDGAALAGLQIRFATVASSLVLEAGIPVTFESNLLADWIGSAGASPGAGLERRLYQNTMASIAARDPRDPPSWIVADRLFRYLVRHPEARPEALGTIAKFEWPAPDIDSPMRAVYPEFVEKRWGAAERANPNGPALAGSDQSGSLNFDTKGVEFGPWIRRFLSQVRRNWTLPIESMSQRGHVTVSFNMHKDGTITEVTVAGASQVESFNDASYRAIAASSPSVPLPPEYPEDQVTMTITFYYNETPPPAIIKGSSR